MLHFLQSFIDFYSKFFWAFKTIVELNWYNYSGSLMLSIPSVKCLRCVYTDTQLQYRSFYVMDRTAWLQIVQKQKVLSRLCKTTFVFTF